MNFRFHIRNVVQVFQIKLILIWIRCVVIRVHYHSKNIDRFENEQQTNELCSPMVFPTEIE